MKLELKILLVALSIFLLINFSIDESKFLQYENSTNATQNVTIFNDNYTIEDTDFIMNEIVKSNQSKDEVEDLTNLSDMVLQKELEEKNQVFIKLANETIE